MWMTLSDHCERYPWPPTVARMRDLLCKWEKEYGNLPWITRREKRVLIDPEEFGKWLKENDCTEERKLKRGKK